MSEVTRAAARAGASATQRARKQKQGRIRGAGFLLFPPGCGRSSRSISRPPRPRRAPRARPHRAHDEGVRDGEGFDGRDRAPSGAARGDHHSAIQLHATGRDETPRRPARSAPYGPDGQNGRSNTARAVQALIRSPRFSVPALFCDCSCTVLGRDRFAHS